MSDFQFPEFDGNALCAETDPEAFFPEKGHSNRAAKTVCTACEIRDACLEWALDNDEQFGVWGGLSDGERRAARRNRARKQRVQRPITHGTEGGYKTHHRRGETPCTACREANALKTRKYDAKTRQQEAS